MSDHVLERRSTDWPDPVEIYNEDGSSDIVLLCEHASHHMPSEYGDLGLSCVDRLRHIAWDIGAAEITRGLVKRLNAPAFLSTYSRLLIDLNRPLDAASSIPQLSESTNIPGNINIGEEEKVRRAARIFTPFHDRVADHITAREKAGRKVKIVTIHSFTPVFKGYARPWHAGILYDHSHDFAQTVIDELRRDPALNVDGNVPYTVSREDDYAIPVHGQDRGHDAILIEIRQDLVSTPQGIAEWTDRLAKALLELSHQE